MICHECGGEAAGQCVGCGRSYCAGEGSDYCRACVVAVAPAGPGGARQREFLECGSRPRLQTVYLDDDGPPSCYRCEGLARRVCEHCHNLYCPVHAGRGNWCDGCTEDARKSLRLSLFVLGFIAGLFALVALLNWLQTGSKL